MKDVSRRRGVIYGVAALWILFCHTITEIPDSALFAPLKWLRFNGSSGVEIFVLLSALGLYHSMERNPDVRGFYWRRFWRVAPAGFLVTAIGFGLYDGRFSDWLCAVTFFPYWFGKSGLWYVPFILTLYLVYPLIYRLQKKHPRALWGLLVATVALSAFFCYGLFPDGELHYLMPVMRFPIFIIGCILGPWAERGGRIPRWTAPACLAAYLAIALVGYPAGVEQEFLRSVSYIFLAGFTIIATTRVAGWLTRGTFGRLAYAFLNFCGDVSLEIYLIYLRLLYFMQQYPPYLEGRVGSLKLECVAVLLTLILSYALRKLCLRMSEAADRARLAQPD